ncbi:MAG: cation:proton antiporter subunit C [Clostridiales bacterium]|jgi:multicomponent Na+:H+ antiporter subunit C|nr:cation:proton antiporter subunit C [Clostridiales bacterium]
MDFIHNTFITNHFEAAAMILFGIGIVTLLVHRNLIKKIIGLGIMDASIFLFLVSQGYISDRRATIVPAEGPIYYERFINPLPGALVITGIVVSVSLTAFALALTLRLYKKYGTLDINEIYLMRGGEE